MQHEYPWTQRVHTPWSAFLRSSSRSMAWDHPDDPSWGFHSQKPQRNPAGRFWWGCPWAVGLWQAWLFLKINAHLGFALHFAGEMSEWIWRGKNTPWACQDCCACMAGLHTLAFFSKICQESTTVLQLERASPKTWRISHMRCCQELFCELLLKPAGCKIHMVSIWSEMQAFPKFFLFLTFLMHQGYAVKVSCCRSACRCSASLSNTYQPPLWWRSEWDSNSYFEGSRRGFNFSASLSPKDSNRHLLK